jgi:tRNA (guanine-N7-)-methyltransferase
MGQKNKLAKFEEIGRLPNVYQSHEVNSPMLLNYKAERISMKGRWAEHFGNNHPIILELACGKGDYALGLARMNPDKNYIGIDLKGNRIWRGATDAHQEGLKNVAFIRSQIDFITHYFEEGEVSEIWITFADPQLTKVRKRLTSPFFLPRYRKILNKQGLMHLKTDSPELYQYTLEIVEEENLKLQYAADDIYSLAEQMPEWSIKTFYEQMHLSKGLTIKYLRFEI